MTRSAKAFTLVELLVVISIIALLVGLLLPALASARGKALQVQDSANLRSIHTGMVIWAQDNNEAYPNAERSDRQNITEAASNSGLSKNRSGALMSLLVYNQNIDISILVSPAEANPDIVVMSEEQYEYRAPERAADTANRSQALYDPGLKGTPRDNDDYSVHNSGSFDWNLAGTSRDDNEGNFSYAHIPLAGAWLDLWSSVNATADQAILSNRGPVMGSAQGSTASKAPTPTAGGISQNDWEPNDSAGEENGSLSSSLRIHGGKSTWEGNVCFNDGHVDFLNKTVIDTYSIPDTTGDRQVPDQLFAAEGRNFQQQNAGQNFLNVANDAYMGTWSAAIATNQSLVSANGRRLFFPDTFAGGWRFSN